MDNNSDSVEVQEEKSKNPNKDHKIKIKIPTGGKKKTSDNTNQVQSDSIYEQYNRKSVAENDKKTPPPPSADQIFNIVKKESKQSKPFEKTNSIQENQKFKKKQEKVSIQKLNSQSYNDNFGDISKISNNKQLEETQFNGINFQMSAKSNSQHTMIIQQQNKKKPINLKIKKKEENPFENENNFQKYRNSDWIKFLNDQKLKWGSRNTHYQIYAFMKSLINKYDGLMDQQFKYEKENEPVSNPIPVAKRASEDYRGAQKIKQLLYTKSRQYAVYRKIKGDGNCFYRAFLFGFLQRALLHQSSLYFIKFLFELSSRFVKFETNSKKSQIRQPQFMKKYTLRRLLQLYTYRQQLTTNNDPNLKIKIIKVLQACFNEPNNCFDIYLIIGLRNYLEIIIKNSKNFSQLDRQTQQSIIQQCNQYARECNTNELAIVALNQNLKITVSLFVEMSARNNQKIQIKHFKNAYQLRDESNFLKIYLYFRPGHYDLIYHMSHAEILYKEIVTQNKQILERQHKL